MPRIKLDIPRTFHFITRMDVRVSDINYGGHMGNDALLGLMHEARIRFLKNWNCTEMNMFGEGMDIVKNIAAAGITLASHQEVIYFPPFTHLYALGKEVNTPQYSIGAQNAAMHEKGAYTGEVACSMIKNCGAQYVIIGHSERRSLFGEDYTTLQTKTDRVIEAGMGLVFCCGETLDERESENHFSIVKQQLEASLFHVPAEAMKQVIIAYEPVWAIGTGKTASPQQAQEMHAYIRNLVAEKYDTTVAAQTSILYGGSVNGANASELFAQPDIDGGLVGGASLKPADFMQIIQSLP